MKRARTFSWRTPLCLLAVLVFAIVTIFAGLTRAQAQVQSANQNGGLVIEGGTLIDGNGGAPVRDAVVAIEGNKITAVATKGKVNYPANATIIRADGKFILPGLFDSQNSYSWYFGEAMLNHGVTSTIDVGTTGNSGSLPRGGVSRKTRGPRTFTGISRLSVNPNALVSTGLEHPLAHARSKIGGRDAAAGEGVDCGGRGHPPYDGALPMDYTRAAFDEAKSQHSSVRARVRPVLLRKTPPCWALRTCRTRRASASP